MRRLGVFGTQKRSAQVMPLYGSEEEMQKQMVEQIRARVKYQKEIMAIKNANNHADEAEMWRWVNITFVVGIPVMFGSILYSYFFDEHAHRLDGDLPEFMVIRSKEFPWQCSGCDLFDMACWKKCKAEKN